MAISKALTPKGLVTFDQLGIKPRVKTPSVAIRNRERINAALAAQWLGGNFYGRGPILYPIVAPGDHYYTIGEIKTSKKISNEFYGSGGRGYLCSNSGYDAAYPDGLGGAMTRITRLDSAAEVAGGKEGSVLLLRGSGNKIGGFQLMGRDYEFDPTTTGPEGVGSTPNPPGIKTPSCIAVEGRTFPSTGSHRIFDCILGGSTVGINVLKGYYDDAGLFVELEAHADQSVVDGVNFYDLPICYQVNNAQAAGWRMRDLQVNGYSGAGLTERIIFNCIRGACPTVDGLSINDFQDTIVKSHEWLPGADKIDIARLHWDQGNSAEAYLTLFEYAGILRNGSNPADYTIRMTGQLQNSETPLWDTSRLLKIPAESVLGIGKTDMLFDIKYLPTAGTELVGGSWRRFT